MAVCLPSTNDVGLKLKSGGFPHGLNNLKNTYPLAFPEVVSFETSIVSCLLLKDLGVLSQCIQGKKVARCQVEHVEIIPDTCSISGDEMTLEKNKLICVYSNVRCRVVIAKYFQLRILNAPYGHMCEQW
jgi:hypothetical protein